jgi:serine/threonine protein kinase
VTDDGKLDSIVAGRYQLVSLLGRGGMGAVYEARHLRTRKRCAVKLLRAPELSGDGEIVRRFFREARAAGLIECEHVVSALDSGVDESGQAYYVMEYLSGEDLSQALDRLGLLTTSAAIKVAAQAARGLASAHALQIVHRDIKPANLFLAQSLRDEIKVKILDFGVAKVKMEVFEESAGTLTQSGSLVGTLQYMSPAQLRRASTTDETADLWSLGILLYECTTGESPWGEADSIGELVTAILTRPVPSVQERAPWAPARLARIIQRATAQGSQDRFASAKELCDELCALVDGDTTLRASDLVAPSTHERSRRAEPLEVADTVDMLNPQSHAPLTASVKPRSARRPLAVLVLGAGLAVTGVWALTRSTGPSDGNARAATAISAAPSTATPGSQETPDEKPLADATVPIGSSSTSHPRPPTKGATSRMPNAPLPPPASKSSASRPDAVRAAAAPAPSAQTILEKMGGNEQWPQSDTVAPP